MILLLLISCDVSEKEHTIEISSIVDGEIAKKEGAKQDAILNDKDKFIKDLGDGAYLEDYSETVDRLTKEANVYYTNRFSEYFELDYQILTELDLYYTMYRRARDENLSYVDIVENYEDYIDHVKLYAFTFGKPANSDASQETLYNLTRGSCFRIEGELGILSGGHDYNALVLHFKEQYEAKFKEWIDDGLSPQLIQMKMCALDDDFIIYHARGDYSKGGGVILK